ncbi:MAG TPA: sigma-70 family RNA polymerase sigma factor [Solirubrobacterales bacterium]|nr:sigma-70 family RNA polymerase sigma factor [Solirubrobacterales bacterium]
MGTDVIPPRAGGLPARLVLGPALRAQSDRRLVRLVREGYEGAFEEIVRRYRRPLGRFAASIVGGQHEDVTQDSFRKALEALRGGDAEIELRPWLYRIVRNTALNDLRDRPPAAAELADELVAGTRSAAAEAEEREEVAELIERLRALPEKQRAALLMRELDGMGHEEIAAALGISKGAARQAIARGRAAVRSGFGALLPLPLVRSLLEGAASTEAGPGALAGAGATAIGAGGAGALKIGLATVVVAGSLGAGVAIEHGGAGHAARPPAGVASREAADDGHRSGGQSSATEDRVAPSPQDVAELTTGRGSSGPHGGGADDRHRDDRGRGRDHREDGGDDSAVGIAGSSAGAMGEDSGRSRSGPGPARGDESASGHDPDADHSGSGGDRGGDSGSGGGRGGSSGSSGGGGGDSGSSGHHGGDSGSSGGQVSGSSGGGGSGSGSSGATASAETSTSGGSGTSSSSSGDSGSSSGSSGSSGSDDSLVTTTSGSPVAPSTAPSETPVEPTEVLDDASSHGGGGGSSGGPGPSGDS